MQAMLESRLSSSGATQVPETSALSGPKVRVARISRHALASGFRRMNRGLAPGGDPKNKV
jgi:hypothetical protein